MEPKLDDDGLPDLTDFAPAFATDFRKLTDMGEIDETLSAIKSIRTKITTIPCARHPDEMIVAVGARSGPLCNICITERGDAGIEEATRIG